MKCTLIYRLLAVSVGLLAGAGAYAADWWPAQINTVDADGAKKPITYAAIDKADKPWKICASYPHVKDSFYLAANYGMVEEAKRLKVQLQVMDAGGFPNLNNQISQIENCVAGGAQAVIISAVSFDGLSNLLAELKKKNVPVIDLYNGMSSADVSARVLAPPFDAGQSTGKYLTAKHPAGSPPVKVAWLPGPAGAGFVELFNQGFKDGVKGSSVEIVTTKYGDIGKEVQARLVEDVLQTFPDLDYIVGTAVTAEAAVPILRARERASRVKVISLYITPGVYRGIVAKSIQASVVQPNVTTARISIDQAVRLLEKREVQGHLSELAGFYDQANIQSMNVGASFAPDAFKPVFRVP